MEEEDYFFGSDEDVIYIKATPEERLDYIGKGLDDLDRDFRKLKEEELLIMAKNIFILNKDIIFLKKKFKEIKTDIRYIIKMQADDYMDLYRELEREKEQRIAQQQEFQKQIDELKEKIKE
jgi:hypothetical protein